MDTKSTPTSPSVRTFMAASILLALLGWGGFLAIIVYTSPTGGTRWGFFFTAMLAITGTLMPFIAFLNRRFPSTPPPTPSVIVRQAIWVSVYLLTLAWLRIGRVLTPSIALLLGLGLILIEWLLRLREKSQWKPGL